MQIGAGLRAQVPIEDACAGRYVGGGLESALARDGQISQQVGSLARAVRHYPWVMRSYLETIEGAKGLFDLQRGTNEADDTRAADY